MAVIHYRNSMGRTILKNELTGISLQLGHWPSVGHPAWWVNVISGMGLRVQLDPDLQHGNVEKICKRSWHHEEKGRCAGFSTLLWWPIVTSTHPTFFISLFLGNNCNSWLAWNQHQHHHNQCESRSPYMKWHAAATYLEHVGTFHSRNSDDNTLESL